MFKKYSVWWWRWPCLMLEFPPSWSPGSDSWLLLAAGRCWEVPVRAQVLGFLPPKSETQIASRSELCLYACVSFGFSPQLTYLIGILCKIFSVSYWIMDTDISYKNGFCFGLVISLKEEKWLECNTIKCKV